jgi:hypothetical protein
MFCESYRQPLIDSLASGEPLPLELAEHLASCSACTSAFVEEQTLFAAIERSLDISVNAPVPPSLVPRAQAQITAAPHKAAWRNPVLAFATLALVAGVVALSPVFHWRSIRTLSGGENRTAAPKVQSAYNDEAIGALVQATPPVKRYPPPSKSKGIVLSQARVRTDEEVLISPEEQAGLDHYAARLRERGLEDSARAVLVTSDPDFKIQALEIAAMDQQHLTIEPLENDEYN